MPHIKVAPFDTHILDALVADDPVFTFRAALAEEAGISDREDLLGLEFEGEAFVLELHKREESWLIKPDKPTRPLDVNRIKRALAYLARKADLDIRHENITLSPTKPPLAEAYRKEIADFQDPDFGGRAVAIEVGFGSGRHLLYQAKAHPEILFIGIEIHTPSAQQVLKQIQLQGIDNVWIVNYDARLLLEMLPSNVARAVYVHFPVPWDKKPHRRVISDPFVREALRVLAPEGFLELRTDSERYYRYALEVFSRPDSSHFDVTKNHEAPIRSKYEDRWQREQKDIYTLRLFAHRMSPPISRECDFTFGPAIQAIDDLLALPRKAIIRPDHFVHFERRYRMTTQEGAVITCSFGSFERPEHKLLSIQEGLVRYYPQPPVCSAMNLQAHLTIGASIHA